MNPQLEQALLQPLEEQQQLELQNERHRLNILNLKQLKAFEILNSAVKNVTSNFKLMILMILSILPFFVFMAFYEIKITEVCDAVLNVLGPTFMSNEIGFDSDENISLISTYDENDSTRKIFRIILELVPFYLFLLPLLELFSLTVVISISAKIYAAKIYAGKIESTTLKETFYQNNNLKGPLITSLWVMLFSTSTLLGLIWAIADRYIVTFGFDYYLYYGYRPYRYYDSGIQVDLCLNILLLVFHALFFLVLLYKYLDWSSLWNMGMVVSVLDGISGLDALQMSAYYRKHCKRTGFQLMLMFFIYSVVVRLPFLLARMCNYEGVRVVATAIVLVLVCFGSLVKWAAIVLYYYDCKAQMLLKKVDDEEMGKAVKSGDICTTTV